MGAVEKARLLRRGATLVAAALLVASVALPYWSITLWAPQYPEGLRGVAYLDRLAGDVAEVDTLNHYIGMMRLGDAAQLERRYARLIVGAVALLLAASLPARGRARWLSAGPLLAYPVGFVADLAAWLYHAGHNLDPHAPLSSSIRPFTPAVLGRGTVGQFETAARFEAGFLMALVAALLLLAALVVEGRSLRRSAADQPAGPAGSSTGRRKTSVEYARG